MKIKKSCIVNITSVVWLIGSLLLLVSLVACGGGDGGGGSAPTGTVNTSITDPPTCNSTFASVWVTITRVRAHISNSAGPNDSGWIDLVDLRGKPRQIDLLSLDSTTCLLTQLGSTSGLPAGQYQQIRLFLLSNNPSGQEVKPSPNNCGSGYNCVAVVGGATEPLDLNSEAQNGIKIPSGQIAGGKFTVLASQSIDLNIDFDACASIIQQANGRYRLKPVLHAGEVSLNNNSIRGRVVEVEVIDKVAINKPIPGALVAVETRDPNNIDRVLMQKTTGQDGGFIFCPLSPGMTYDIVAGASNSSITYGATVTLSVPLGTNMGDIPLVPQTGGAQPARISGQITTTSTLNSPTPVDINLSPLQSVGGGNPLIATIPVFEGSTPNVTTATAAGCLDGTDCTTYTLLVPASNPRVGTFSITPATSYTDPSTGEVHYWVNAQAFDPSTDLPDCSPSSLPSTFANGTQIAVSVGNVTDYPFVFTGCHNP